MNEKTANPITIEMTTTAGYFRLGCSVCGGCTEKNLVAAESPPGTSPGIRVCETCLEAGNIDVRLLGHADALERQAAQLRLLVGRLKVPTFAEWQAANDEEEALAARERGDPNLAVVPAALSSTIPF